MAACARVAGGAGCEAGEEGTKALSTGVCQVVADGTHRRHAGSKHGAKMLLGPLELISHKCDALGHRRHTDTGRR